jgi:hypothetical protein
MADLKIKGKKIVSNETIYGHDPRIDAASRPPS